MPLTIDQFLARVAGDDLFRISIRGQAALEQTVDEGVEAAFAQDAQAQARSFGGFERRLGLAIALGIVRAEHRSALMTSARLRNELAHGSLDDVPEDRIEQLAVEVRNAAGGAFDDWLDHGEGRVLLVRALTALFVLVVADLDAARGRREDANAGLELLTLQRVLQARRDALTERLGE